MTFLDERYNFLRRRLDRNRISWTREVDAAPLEDAVVVMARLAGSIAPEAVVDPTTEHWRDGI